MRGLLAKDFCLFLQRKRYFATILLIGVFLVFSSDSTFAIGYTTMIAAFFTISSISYDEYDQCYPFLFTLPIDGKTYALEKFVFGWILSSCTWLLFTGMAIVRQQMTQANGAPEEILFGSVILVMVVSLGLAFCIPVNLKFGMEKGRTVLFIFFGIIALVVIFAPQLGNLEMINLVAILEEMSELMILGIVAVVTLIGNLVGLKISENIVCKKEF